jgi:hypothetical protein
LVIRAWEYLDKPDGRGTECKTIKRVFDMLKDIIESAISWTEYYNPENFDRP